MKVEGTQHRPSIRKLLPQDTWLQQGNDADAMTFCATVSGLSNVVTGCMAACAPLR